MEISPFKIPRVIYLPGLRIKVRKRKLKGAYGVWDDSTQTISLDRNLPLSVQRYVLFHELQHVVNDYLHAGLMTEEKLFQLPEE